MPAPTPATKKSTSSIAPLHSSVSIDVGGGFRVAPPVLAQNTSLRCGLRCRQEAQLRAAETFHARSPRRPASVKQPCRSIEASSERIVHGDIHRRRHGDHDLLSQRVGLRLLLRATPRRPPWLHKGDEEVRELRQDCGPGSPVLGRRLDPGLAFLRKWICMIGLLLQFTRRRRAVPMRGSL